MILLPALAFPLSPGGPYNTSGFPQDDTLNVHIVCHSHNDVGWLKTVDEYFQGLRDDVHKANVRQIYDSVLDSLSEDRKFHVSEIAYFTRWWRRATEAQKTKFRALVASGAITFVGGGWVQHDEAVVLYSDAIDQLSLGHEIISRIFGSDALPTVAWQLDPFGHSRWSAEFFSDAGLSATVVGRVDSQEFAIRQYRKQQEFISARGGLVALMPDGYGPPPLMDFGDYPWLAAEVVTDDPELEGVNVHSRMQEIFIQIEERWRWLSGQGSSPRSGDLMLLLGSDFQYGDARRWFENLDKIIHYSKFFRSTRNFNLFYSTPEMYFKERARKEAFAVDGRSIDLFPYGDGEAEVQMDGRVKAKESHSYWTGYFSSRTGFKRLVREAGECLRVGELLMALFPKKGGSLNEIEGEMDDVDLIIGKAGNFSASENQLFAVAALRDALATAQHHDAVTGTEKFRVLQDYVRRIEDGMKLMRATVERFIGAEEWLGCGNPKTGRRAGKKFLVLNPSTASVKYRMEEILGNQTIELAPLSGKEVQVVEEPVEVAAPFDRHEFPGRLHLAFFSPSNGSYHQERPNQAAGAYIFRPACPEGPVAPCEPQPIKWPGARVHAKRRRDLEVANARQVFQVEIDLPEIPIDGSEGKEVVLVFQSEKIKNHGIFYTDSQGRGLIRREQDKRPHFDLDVTDPVSGNFYPINTMVVMNGTSSPFSVAVTPDRPMGVASLKSGELTFLLHRRLLFDDNRGVGEPLNQTDGIRAAKFYFSFDLQGRRRLDEDLVDTVVTFPVQLFSIGGAEIDQRVPEIIPPSVAVLSIRRRSAGVQLRFAHKHATGKIEEVDLDKFTRNFLNKTMGSCKEMLITGAAEFGARDHIQFSSRDGEPEKRLKAGLEGIMLTIHPGDIRTVLCSASSVIFAESSDPEIRTFST